MLSVSEVTNPRFQGWRIVFAHALAVGEDASLPADGCPFGRGIEEGDIDLRVAM